MISFHFRQSASVPELQEISLLNRPKVYRYDKIRKSQKGFTLIELLVVIAIIGILSSVALASLRITQARARDSERLSDLRQIQTALETYRNDRGSYPSTGSTDVNNLSWRGVCSGFGSYSTSGATGWIPNLAPTYISVLPTDPKPIAPNNCYLYTSYGNNYMVMAYGTVETKISTDGATSNNCVTTPGSSDTNPANRPSQPGEADFAFFTPGACGW